MYNSITADKKLWKAFSLSLVVICCLSLIACGSTGSKKTAKKRSAGGEPDWILNTPIEPGFLYGVGAGEIFGSDQANAIARAKDMARVELVKQISVNVSGEVDQEISETTKNGATSLTEKLRQAVKSRVPEYKLTHVTQSDSHKSGKKVYALVQLNVTKELQGLRRQINDLDMQIDDYAQKFEQQDPHGMSAIRLVAPALILVDQRADLQARHNGLSSASSSSPLLTDEIREFVRKVYERIGEMRVAVNSDNGNANNSFQTALIADLTKRGIRVSNDGESDIQIVYKLDINNVRRDGSVFAITNGDIWIKDETGRVVKAFQAKAKGVSGDEREAQSRSIKKLSHQMGSELMSALF